VSRSIYTNRRVTQLPVHRRRRERLLVATKAHRPIARAVQVRQVLCRAASRSRSGSVLGIVCPPQSLNCVLSIVRRSEADLRAQRYTERRLPTRAESRDCRFGPQPLTRVSSRHCPRGCHQLDLAARSNQCREYVCSNPGRTRKRSQASVGQALTAGETQPAEQRDPTAVTAHNCPMSVK